jgi:hypothetical protein
LEALSRQARAAEFWHDHPVRFAREAALQLDSSALHAPDESSRPACFVPRRDKAASGER